MNAIDYSIATTPDYFEGRSIILKKLFAAISAKTCYGYTATISNLIDGLCWYCEHQYALSAETKRKPRSLSVRIFAAMQAIKEVFKDA